MAQHVLSVEAPDTLNLCIFRVVDTSIYNPDSAPVCPLLQITPPGFTYPVNFTDSDITVGFNLNLTACDFGLQVSNCGTTYADLPDGIWIIKYSVSPNDLVYAEYNHLRITAALNKVQKVYCSLDLGTCDPPVSVKKKLDQITYIQQLLSAAKAEVEFCHHPAKGMELYNYAIKLLGKMTCATC